MSISLITYDGGQLSAQDHALMAQAATGAGGVIYGCAATASGNQAIRIADGVGILLGRLFHITAQTLDVTLPSANYIGQVYVTIDLSNTEAPISLSVRTGATLEDLVSDEDFNWANGIGYLPIASFTVSSSGVANIEDINRIGSASSGGGGGAVSGNTYHTTWYGCDVDVAVNGKTVCVNCYGNTNAAVTIKNTWLTVANLSSLFQCPRMVEGYAIINTLQSIRYQVDENSVLRFGHVRNVAGGGVENLAKGYAVKFVFSFSIV